VVIGGTTGTGDHVSTAKITPLLCPSFPGDDEAGASYAGINDCGAGTYVATVGTHTTGNTQEPVRENGAIVSGYRRQGRGTGINDMSDGVSKTVLLTESKEEDYNSWYCGSSTWVVALDPLTQLQTVTLGADGLPILNETLAAINLGPDLSAIAGSRQTQPYWPAMWSGEDRSWGPSSEHAGGVVIHSYGDGHTQSITDAIEPRVYYALISRNGGETVDQTQQ
jgi:hypothetical protein